MLSSERTRVTQVKAKGSVDVTVQHNNQTTKLPLLIVEGAGPMLIGRNEMEQLRLDWCDMCEIKEDRLQEILAKHDEVFKPELGKLQVFQAQVAHTRSSYTKILQSQIITILDESKNRRGT